MGFRLVSLAVREKSREAALTDLGLAATGATAGHLEEHLAGAQIGEWYVVLVHDSSPFRGHVDDGLLAKISADAEIVVCGAHETNMASFATAWADGRQTWSVLHELNLEPRHLAREGDVPEALSAIREAAALKQDAASGGVDFIFDVPIDLGAHLTGFRHDSMAADARRWDVLRELAPTPRKDNADRYMEVEDRPATHWPLAFQARAAIDAMTPRGGPGFVVLSGPGEDYMQTAGGDGAYTAEWREHIDGAFRHYVAGRKGLVMPGTIELPTNGGHITVRRNEALDAAEVKRLATAFLRRESRPATFAWRDNSAMFV